MTIEILSEGLFYSGSPLAVGQIKDFDAVTEAAFVATGKASYDPVPNTPGGFKQPVILAQSGVPVILPSSGSSNASGQITLTTALPYVPSGVVKLYLPAGVVTGGSQGNGAGLYLVTFSSTTVCKLAGTNIVTANAGYTQDLTLVNMASVVVKGGSLGNNGAIRAFARYTHPNNANTKTCAFRFNGINVGGSNSTTATTTVITNEVNNRGVQNSQVGGLTTPILGPSVVYSAVDTSQDQTFAITGVLGVATDYIILEGYTVEAISTN